MRQTTVFYLLFSFYSTFCQADCRQPVHYQWLVGNWSTQGQTTQITESWQQISTDTLEGQGSTIKAGQVVTEESLRLVLMGNELFYLAKVPHNPLPVAFKLTQCSEHQARFDNAQHDFPNRIEYRLISASELEVDVRDNEGKGFTLNFIRQ
ncbi:DUF6265 family protein [Neptunicella sp. SCSIO 80796]|uniref:DUF6265 family protein n=1 Tax=Neptunicella plasticusilytica TaxID=3117012 RepID=UPI003A4DAD39